MKSFMAIFVIVACFATIIYAENRVKLVVMTESLCPDCIQFANTDLKELIEADGVFEYTDIQYLAWGNAYSETTSPELCPSPTPGKYNGSVLKCWSTHCVRDAPPALFAECFNNSFADHITCQHGEEECYGNRIEACAVHVSRNTTSGWMSRVGAQFIQCFLGTNKGRKESTLACATYAGIPYDNIMKCVNTSLGTALLSEAAVETNDYGTHPGVPYILVNGVVLPDGASLVKAVCDQIQGTKPRGCRNTVFEGHRWGKC